MQIADWPDVVGELFTKELPVAQPKAVIVRQVSIVVGERNKARIFNGNPIMETRMRKRFVIGADRPFAASFGATGGTALARYL